MAINTSANDQPDNTIGIVGNNNTEVAQDANGRLESVMLGDAGSAISQDGSGRLESVLIGNEGIAIDQEPSTGKGLMRLGGESSEADVDIGSVSSPTNIGSGGSEFQSGQRSTGGATEIAFSVNSSSSATFNVHIDWMDENGNVLRTESPPGAQGVTDVEKGTVICVSDNFELRVEDASGSATNNVHGSANAH